MRLILSAACLVKTMLLYFVQYIMAFNYFDAKILTKMNKLRAIAGPTKNANSKVPIPTTPPNAQPTITADISIPFRTQAIGAPVKRCKPVINPSLGPAPKLAVRYIPPPIPVIKIPARAYNT